MSSAGHILDMNNRIKQNKILRKRKKFKEDNRENSYAEKFDIATEYDFPIVSEAELELIEVHIRETAKTNDRKSLYILAILTAFVAFAFWFFLQYYHVDPFISY